MPQWAENIIMALIAAATGGTAWWFKSWRDDRIKREDTQQKIVEQRDETIAALYLKVESLFRDALAREQESNALRTERLAMDKQLAALVTAMTAALDRQKGKDGP